MNAKNGFAIAWRARTRPARATRLARAQRGFALVEGGRRPGLPERAANANARFEAEARAALREWLMV